jgi:hypothetical protein
MDWKRRKKERDEMDVTVLVLVLGRCSYSLQQRGFIGFILYLYDLTCVILSYVIISHPFRIETCIINTSSTSLIYLLSDQGG